MKKPSFTMKSLTFSLCLLSFCGVALGQSIEKPASQKLPTVTLAAGVHLIKAEVAASEAEKRQGLMHRQSLGKNEGMLFVYAEPMRLCMWMKNTSIPLSVAFIDVQGKIVNMADMTPYSTQAHCALRPVSYALEMRRGWFREKNLGPGSVIGGLNGGE